jgi:hypothetical protein
MAEAASDLSLCAAVPSEKWRVELIKGRQPNRYWPLGALPKLLKTIAYKQQIHPVFPSFDYPHL